MSVNNKPKVEIEELLTNHLNGFYTSGEVVAIVIGMLDESNIAELWQGLPNWLRSEIISLLSDFSESDELISFGRGDADFLKKQNLFVKNWLYKNKEI